MKWLSSIILCLLLFVFFGGTARAKEMQPPKGSQETVPLSKKKWLPSPLFGFFKLQWNIPVGIANMDTPGSQKADGIMSGLYGAAESISKIGYFGIELDMEYGRMSPKTGSKFDLVKLDWDVKGGYPFAFNLGSKKAMIALFGGLAPIFSNSEDRNNLNQRMYAIGSLSGIKFEIALSEKWRCATDLAFRSIWWGQMEIKTSTGKVTNDLKTSGGVRWRGFIEFFLTEKISLSFILKYEIRPLKIEDYGTIEHHFLTTFLGMRFHF